MLLASWRERPGAGLTSDNAQGSPRCSRPVTAPAARGLRTPAQLQPAPGEGLARPLACSSGLLAAAPPHTHPRLGSALFTRGREKPASGHVSVSGTQYELQNRSRKAERSLPLDPAMPLLGTLRRNRNTGGKEHKHPCVSAALLTVTETRKQPQCPPAEWIKPPWDVHTTRCCAAVRKKEVYPLQQRGRAWRTLC